MFYMAYGILEHGAYYVDALWGHTELLKDWAVMTDLLLELELSQAEESFLIELLTCSALRAAGGSPPPGRVYKRIIGNKERKIISSVSLYLTSPSASVVSQRVTLSQNQHTCVNTTELQCCVSSLADIPIHCFRTKNQ